MTGATGLVGSWLIKRLLEQEATVIALVRDADPQTELYRSGDINRIQVVSGSLEDIRSLERAVAEGVQVVMHLGAQTIVGTALRSPLATFEANVRGTYNLLEVCRVHRDLLQAIVIASSDKAYGDSPTLPYTEDMPLIGRHPYDVSKSCTDMISFAYAHTYGLPLTVARCGNIYGGGDLNWSRIVPGTIRSLLFNEAPILRSDGSNIRDYVYVKDVVNAYLLLAEQVSNSEVCGEAFNFSPESRVNVLEMVKNISRLMNCEHIEPIVLAQARAEIQDQYLDSKKAANKLGWRSQYSLDNGLLETITWYKRFLGVM